MLRRIEEADIKMMQFVANRRNRLLEEILASFSALSSTEIVLFFIPVLFTINSFLFKEFVIGISATWITVYGLKFLLYRERPDGNKEAGFTPSFPSAHSATAFMMASIFSSYLPELAAYLYLTAILISFSRIYLQTHYLSDVLTGAAIGIIIASVI